MMRYASSPPETRAESINKYLMVDGHRELVLDSIGFALDDVEFVSIIGPTGSGKSTLPDIIAGLDSPDAGTVTIEVARRGLS